MRELLLIRHGESEHHVRNLSGGWTDTPLTERGKQQAAQAGRVLVSFGVTTETPLYTSDLIRAEQSANAIAEVTGQNPLLRNELRELNNGVAKDKTIAEAREIQLPITQPTIDWVAFERGESWRDLSHRVGRFLLGLSERHQEETVVVVSHGNTSIAVVHWWLKLPPDYWSKISYEFDTASITRLTVNTWGEQVISKLNETSHLAGN